MLPGVSQKPEGCFRFGVYPFTPPIRRESKYPNIDDVLSSKYDAHNSFGELIPLHHHIRVLGASVNSTVTQTPGRSIAHANPYLQTPLTSSGLSLRQEALLEVLPVAQVTHRFRGWSF